MKKLVLLLCAVMLLAVPAVTQAQADDARIQRLEKALNQLQSELSALKAQKGPVDQQQIDVMVGKAIEKEKANIPAWTQNIMSFTGDLRYRFEAADDDSNTEDRRRNSVRGRVTIFGKVNDDMDLILRFTSGTETLDGEFGDKSAEIDQMYFDWHPDTLDKLPFLGTGVDFLENIAPFYQPGAFDGTHILGGKIPYPFYTPVNSTIVFDGQNLEGIAGTIKKTVKDNVQVFGTAGAFWVEERPEDVDSGVWAIQSGATYQVPELNNGYMTAAIGYFDFMNVENETLSGFSGNTASKADSTKYQNDYDIVTLGGEVGMDVMNKPVVLFAEAAENIAARNDKDSGYVAGVSIGSIANVNDWQFVYNYSDVEADAVVGAFASGFSDGADIRGHKFELGYKLAKNVTLTAGYALGEKDAHGSNPEDYDEFTLDFVVKF